ncbi:MAG: DUF3313 domain-containing protein [Deltaproteobacteria bacterium]|nr:DUF3313 domain-containing protein [Deltaproteobacteria bacterium]MDH3802441.1 DUF3313 domain-containing protein [Deltaproteobacteria bacterium]MDH3896437.1 DUF3313 domain-containing protein [Deltaproteobacteria bacterium]MDH3927761.1 DUF3313 domain-containing protein [Deltaproteobacteria bacterium]MDH3963669.1 DUF3313 domain-containing protein [Deltaproteobacteria bacterium]
MNWLLRVVLLSALALLIGCATSQSKQARTVEKSGFLGDYSMLSPGGEGEALLFYENPEANWPSYNKIFLAPVAYYGGRDTYPKGFTRADLQKLVNRFYYILYNDLAEDYQMVDEPAPHTLRIQVALTSVGESSQTADSVSAVAPVIVNPIRNFAGSLSGETVFAGQASIEIKITDELTGKLLFAAVDRRVGQRTMSSTTSRTADVEEIMWYWGDLARYKLCMLRGGEKCIMPEQ